MTTSTTRIRRSRPRRNPVKVEGRHPFDLRVRVQQGPNLRIDQPWTSKHHDWSFRLALILPLLLFGFSLVQNLGNMDTVDFHRDEARWINRAHFAGDLLDPFGETWSDHYLTRGQPPLGNYLMGVGLLMQGRDLDTNRVWDFAYDEAWNVSAGAMPDSADLNAGRRTNAAVGALVVVCVYLLTARLTNRFGGFIAGFVLSVHPLHLRLSSQALSDELLALTIVLALLAAFRFARKPDLGAGLVLGAMLGLGGAAKLSPLLMTLPLTVYGGAWLLLRVRSGGPRAVTWRLGRFGWLLVLQPVIAFATFVAVNPYLWPDPIGRSLAQFIFRRTEMAMQSSAWPVAGVGGPLAALARSGRRLDLDYSATSQIQTWFGNLVSVSFQPVSLDVALMAAGLVTLGGIVVRRGVWSPSGLVALLMAGQAAIVIVGMGVDFYRYFLPLLVIGAICIGVGAGAGFKAVRRWRLAPAATSTRQAQAKAPSGRTVSGYNHAGISRPEDAPAQP